MQQGSKSTGFTITEAVYRAFGFIPPPSAEPSLLHSDDPEVPPPLAFYMDDFFGGFPDFDRTILVPDPLAQIEALGVVRSRIPSTHALQT